MIPIGSDDPARKQKSPVLNVNGRFLTRQVTGVERVAQNMVDAIIEVLAERRSEKGIRLLLPSMRSSPALLQPRHSCQHGVTGGQFWEQFELPFRAGGDWLYSPCNLAPVLRRRSIVTIHDAQVFLHPESYSIAFRTWYKAVLPLIARRARIVTTVSRHSLATLERFGVIPPGKGHVIYNGADHVHAIKPDYSVLAKFGLKPGCYYLVVGSKSPHKNLGLVNLVNRLRGSRDMPIVVAGGVYRSMASTNFREEAGVISTERISDAELKALYSAALCLLFPSLSEGFGLPPLEAMACGCPVIASTSTLR